MILLGELSLWMALLMSVWSAVVRFIGAARSRADLSISGLRAMRATLAFLVIAAAALLTAIVSRDFSNAYVAAHVSSVLPAAYVPSAVWAGPEGALLFCTLLLAVAANVGNRIERAPHAAGVMAVLVAGCVGLLVIAGNPFERSPWVPPDGRGLRPDLQTAVFSIYPPLLYAGLVASALPFTLVAGRTGLSARDDGVTRRWIALAWLLLTSGILAGLWWEWSMRGWNTTWQVQPLRNTTFLAWAAVTAVALHSWSSGLTDRTLAAVAFLLSAFAAVAVTAEHASRVEAFARSRLAAGLLVAVVAGLVLSSLVSGRSGAPLAEPPKSRGPLRALAAIGSALLIVGLVAASFRRDVTVALPGGGQVTATDLFDRTWTFTSAGTSRYDIDNRRVTAITMSASVNGAHAGVLSAELRQYVDGRGAPTFPPVASAGALHLPAQSIQAALTGFEDGDSALVTVTFHPLIALVWLGGAVLALAGFALLWPATRLS